MKQDLHSQSPEDLFDLRASLITLFEAIPDNVIFKDAHGRWLVANAPARKFFQLDNVAWQSKTDAELGQLHPSLKPLHDSCISSDEAVWVSGKTSTVIERGLSPDGRLEEHEVHKVPLFLPDGRRKGLVIIGRDVTEKRQLARAVKLSETMASESRDVLLLIRNSDGRIFSANKAATEFYGYSQEELLTKTIYDLRQTNDAAQTAYQMSVAFANGILFETVHVHKGGHTIPVEVSSHRISLDGEDFLVSAIRDISVRKKAEAKLLQLEQSVGAAANGIFLVDLNGKIFWVNAAFTKMTGYSAEEAIGKNPRFLKSGQHNTEFYQKLWSTVQARKVWQAEIINRRKDGTLYPENKTITPVKDAAGNISHFICVQEDITERNKAEKMLQASEERYRQIVDNARDLIFILAPDGKFISVNPVVHGMSGLGADHWIGKPFIPLVHPDDLPLALEKFQCVMKGETVQPYELRGHPSLPRPVSIEITVFARKDAHGKIIGVMGIGRDITERKQTEAALEQSHSLLQATLESTADGILVVNATGKISGHNQKFLELWQIPPALIASGDDRQLLEFVLAQLTEPEKFLTRVQALYQSAEATPLEEVAFRDGRVFERYSQPQQIGDTVAGRVWSFRDITARKQAEAKIQAAATFNQATIDALAAHLCVLGEDGEILATNRAWKAFAETGSTTARNVQVGGNYLAVCDATVGPETEDARTFAAGIRAVIHGERDSFSMEYPCHSPEKQNWFLASVTRFNQTHPVRVVVIHENVTTRKQMEAKMEQINEELELRVAERTKEIAALAEVIDNTTVPFVMSGLDGILLTVNRAFEQLLGFDRTELLDGQRSWITDLTPPEWRKMQNAQIQNALRTRQPVHYEKEYFCKDGSRVPVELFVQPIFDAAGQFQHLRTFVTDITERKVHEAKLAEDSHEIEELYNNAPCGYHSLNQNGEFVRINDTELAWLGYTRAELLGRNMAELLTPEYKELFKKSFIGFTNADQKSNLDIELIKKDGTIFYVVMNTAAARDDAGNFIESRTTVFDNTERKKVTEELEKAWRLANEASRAKSEFLANMSHEIRTPLNAILGFTHLLRHDSSLPEPVLDKLQIIGKSGDNLLTILNDILDLAKVEAGRMVVQPVEFSCTGLLEEVIKLFRPAAEAKQLSLVLIKSGELPHLIRADEEKIRRVFSNLLGNALKFTRAGGIEVTVKTVSAGVGSPVRLHIAVKDTGPGIAPEEISRLFHKFEQTSTGRATQTGTGLGLAISQQYARLLGGNITVHSQVGLGSTFEFNFPIEPVFETEHIQHKLESSARRLAPGSPDYRVLVVDDLEDNRNFLVELLNLAGFVCRPAASGAEALSVAAEWFPQLVLMDTRMPEMDGLETIRRLRARPESSALKIISLSAMAFAEDQEAALAAGADDFVAKPAQPEELLKKIGGLLGLSYSTHLPLPEDKSSAPAFADENVIPQKLLARLPEVWPDQMREALELADVKNINALIKVMEPHDPRTAKTLFKLVNQFDYEGILQLLTKSRVP